MSAELKALVDSMTPWQRHLYEQIAAGGRVYWVADRPSGRFMIQKALELRAKEEQDATRAPD